MICECIGYILAVTDKAFGVAADIDDEEIELWVPRSLCNMIEYENGGDEEDPVVGEAIRSLDLVDWFAEKEGMA